MQRVERDPRDTRTLSFTFQEPERSGRVVFELTGARIEVPGRVLLEGAEMWLERGEHVTLVGANGTGKTTLIETLAGKGELVAGKLSTGHNVTIGYVSQHAEELSGPGSLLDATQRATGLTPGKARALLGMFLFSGEEAEKPVEGLSGGERRRFSLAVLVNSGANLLVLDEPTNHLDLESREALEDALREFPGSLLLVSHDRALLDAVGTRTIAVEDGTLRTYEGGWPEYVRVREERKELAQAPRAARTTNGAPKPKPKPAPAAATAPSKNQRARAARLERQIEEAEAQLKALEEELAAPAAWASPSATERNTARHEQAK